MVACQFELRVTVLLRYSSRQTRAHSIIVAVNLTGILPTSRRGTPRTTERLPRTEVYQPIKMWWRSKYRPPNGTGQVSYTALTHV